MSLFIFCAAIILAVITGALNVYKPGEIKAMVTIICLTLPIFQMIISLQQKNETDGQLDTHESNKVSKWFLLALIVIVATSTKTLLWDETQPFEPNIRHTLYIGTLWIAGTFTAGFILKKVPFVKKLFALW